MNDDKQRLAELLGKVPTTQDKVSHIYRDEPPRIDADARPGAQGPLTEEDYRGIEMTEAKTEKREMPERSPLELASSFLGDHRVVELLEAGARPLITYTVLRVPDGECRVMATFHGVAREDGTAENTDELTVAHVILLDMLRRQIDRVYEPGAAARWMFATATDPDPLADQSEAGLLRTRPTPEAPEPA